MFPSVTFATTCWEKDWRHILLTPGYLAGSQIGHHQFPFSEKLLIINNVTDLDQVKQAAQTHIDQGTLTRYIVAEGIPPIFELSRSLFNDWQYYNALGPLSAIHHASSEYLLYQTGDVYLKKPIDWIDKALRFMQKRPQCKVANLTWNDNYREAQRESYRRSWNFFIASRGFSDQMFLIRKADFHAPIYGAIHPESSHYPRGGVWEARVFSHMLNEKWQRITFKRGSYTHENL